MYFTKSRLPFEILYYALEKYDLPVLIAKVLDSHLFIDTVDLNSTLKIVRYSEAGEFEIVDDLKQKFKLLKIQAKLWSALVIVLGNPDCQKKYVLNNPRRDFLCKLSKFNNQNLLLQLPYLKNLFDYLSKLQLAKFDNLRTSSSLIVTEVLFHSSFSFS